jgi:hypothetical protein
MALTEPLDLLTDFPGSPVSFELAARQEQSRHASGRTRTKDFGTPIWQGSWQSRPLGRAALDVWRARLEHAMITQLTFTAYGRCRPMAHQGAGVLPEGELAEIGDDDKTVSITGLTGISLAVGDHVRIGGGLYRVMEPVTGTPTGLFEVSPHLWSGTAVTDDVIIEKPWCLMTIDPGSVSAPAGPSGRGVISFSATEAR